MFVLCFKIYIIIGPEELRTINHGMQQIQNTSCIKFVPRTLEDDYINIINGNGCLSTIGRVKGGQDLSLQSKCLTLRTVTNVLMYALGFPPEHNRPDRDDYIDIDQNNLKGKIKSFFCKICYYFKKYKCNRRSFRQLPEV